MLIEMKLFEVIVNVCRCKLWKRRETNSFLEKKTAKLWYALANQQFPKLCDSRYDSK